MKKALFAVLMCAALFPQTALFAQTKAAPKAAGAGQAPADFRVKMVTTKGTLLIDVHRDWAPHGADRFYQLVRSGFFTNVAFYRVVAGFMAQFGINPSPDVNKKWDAQKLADDKPAGHSNARGTLTFANTGEPNSRGTQLFISYRDNAYLDKQAAPFLPIGEVVEGMDVADMFFSGYGDTSGKGSEIEASGQPYIDRYFPKLDKITSATIVPIPKPDAKDDKK
jgi:peptidyl-prolyl cis-trans isomerase A (cyclophilin A)